jgi:transposase
VIANILNLPQWRVLAVEEADTGEYVIRAEYLEPPLVCTRCGVEVPKVYVHQYDEQVFNDLPHHGKRTALLVKRKRYKCRECQQVFLQELPHMHEHHRATKRLVEWVGNEAMRHTFAHVARLSGFDERTVRRIFEAHIEALDRSVQFETPEWLGIDEVHLLKSARGVFANLKEWTVIEMLPDRRKDRVTRALLHLPDRHKVQLVAMDMTRAYLDACSAALPQAVVVIDKFHVVRMASEAMETVRKSVRKDLNSRQRVKLMHDRFKLLRRNRDLEPRDRMLIQTWFTTYPHLGEAYRAKEAFYDLYDESADSQEAKERIDAWRASLPASVKAPFKKLMTALRNWEPQVLTYFDHKATNAPTEALNGAIKRMQSEGRGYSFEALRAKVLYGKPHKKGKTSIRSLSSVREASFAQSLGERNYGVPFDSIGEDDYTESEHDS